MRFYAGIPLVSAENLPIGTLCVLDTIPRTLDDQQIKALKVLADQVMARISLRTLLKTERQLKQKIQQQHDELLQMNDQLRKADESKDLYLAMLAHELRNPLSAIHNGLRIIDTADDADIESDTVQMLKRQCTQLTRLLDDLLDVSRISRGKVSLSKETIALRPILENSLATVLTDARSKRQTLILEQPISDVAVNADTTRLTQIVVNLLSNAIRYTPERGEVVLSTGVVDNNVAIQVRLAATGQQALEAIAQQLPDVLLLDIGLPDITGHQVASEVRQTYPHTPLLLIATTGYGQAKDRLQSANAGFDHHLVKPVNLNTLYGILQEHAEDRQTI